MDKLNILYRQIVNKPQPIWNPGAKQMDNVERFYFLLKSM